MKLTGTFIRHLTANGKNQKHSDDGGLSLCDTATGKNYGACRRAEHPNAMAHRRREGGVAIQKLHLVATPDTDPDRQVGFTLDSVLAVSGLKLPKAEKGWKRMPRSP